MASTPEMMDSVNVLILADRGVIIEDISEQLGISVGATHKSAHEHLAFSNVSSHWVLPGQFKTSYCSKNSGNHQSVWLRTAATFSL